MPSARISTVVVSPVASTASDAAAAMSMGLAAFWPTTPTITASSTSASPAATPRSGLAGFGPGAGGGVGMAHDLRSTMTARTAATRNCTSAASTSNDVVIRT